MTSPQPLIPGKAGTHARQGDELRRNERRWERRVFAFLACSSLGATAAPSLAAEDGWRTAHAVDPVTDAVRDGAVFQAGADRFLAVCTHNRSGPPRFWVQVQTDAALGRRGVRSLTYRVGDEPPTTSQWDYTSREAVPVWPFEDRHIVERVLKGGAQRLVLRLATNDGSVHDVAVPIDDAARALLSKTLAQCSSGRAP